MSNASDGQAPLDFQSQFGSQLLLAMREAADPAMSHWAAGHARLAQDRARALAAGGLLEGFSEIVAGVAARKVQARDQAMFREGTGLVALDPRSPWEAPDLARSCIESHGEAWICLRLSVRDYSGGGQSHWCCSRVGPESEFDFEPVWARMARELARAEITHCRGGGSSGMEARAARLEALDERMALRSMGLGPSSISPAGPLRV